MAVLNQTIDGAKHIVADLEQRLEIAMRTVEKLAAERKQFAFNASQGNLSAQTELARLTREEFQAQNNGRDLRDALTEARVRLAAAIKAAEDAEVDRLLTDAQNIGAELSKHAAAFDKYIASAAAEIQACEECRNRLARTGALEGPHLNRVASKYEIQRAVAMTDLGRAFDYVGASTRQPLLMSTQQALSAIKRPVLKKDVAAQKAAKTKSEAA
jgi:hypothetical protein